MIGHRGGRLVIANLKAGSQNKDVSLGESPQICGNTQLYLFSFSLLSWVYSVYYPSDHGLNVETHYEIPLSLQEWVD